MGEKYSLWLVPEDPAYTTYHELVKSLATTYNAPLFVPHLTLLPDVELSLTDLKSAIEALSLKLSSVMLVPDQIYTGETFFQCILARITKTPELIALHTAVAAAINQQPDEKWLPHLSLMYGDKTQEFKQKVVESLTLELPSFQATQLSIWLSGPDPEQWEKMAEYKLGKD